MSSKDERVDRYVARAPDFARPILKRVRAIVHRAVPGIGEDIKWGAPAYVSEGLVCSTPAFKDHVAVWFHKGAMLEDPRGLLKRGARSHSMKSVRLAALSDLDGEALADLVRQAAALNARGIKPKPPARPVVVPPALAQALARHREAKAFFERLAPSHRRAYADHVAEAKRPETVERRVAWTIAELARGHRPDEKYRRSLSKRATARKQAS